MSPDQINSELQRVLAYGDMRASPQMSRFLAFVVGEALAGREAMVKERTVAIQALDRDEDFDPRLDAIVRIVAGKLRRTMDRYYLSEGASNKVRIVIPKGTYCPSFVARPQAPAGPDAAPTVSATGGDEAASGSDVAAAAATTIVLVDDHAILRAGMRLLLEQEDDVTVMGEAADGQQAIDLVRKLAPDVVVMDISMPTLNGIDAARQILAQSPETRVLALSVHAGRRFVEDMLRAGAAGYVLKESAPEELVQAIRALSQGRIYLSPAITGVVVAHYRDMGSDTHPAAQETELTSMERAVLGLTVDGNSAQDVATSLAITEVEAASARRRIMQKLGVTTLEELAQQARPGAP